MADRNVATKDDVFAAAVWLTANDDLTDDQIVEERQNLLNDAHSRGIEITIDEIDEHIEEREEDGRHVPSYSWVHLNEFRLFELHGRCFPWSDTEELRHATERTCRQEIGDRGH